MSDQDAFQHTQNDIVVRAEAMFEYLARRFPVCMASDEFHFFPQAISKSSEPSWDDFSPDGLAETAGRLRRWEKELAADAAPSPPIPPSVEQTMLFRAVRTLREQLTLVRVHETQPTYYLTIVGIGLAEALAAGSRSLQSRLERLPAFLYQAQTNLRQIPRLFRDLGVDMLVKQRAWLKSLPFSKSLRNTAEDAFDRLHHHLQHIPVQEEFRPSPDLYERIARDHMGCLLSPEEIVHVLDEEVAETRALLESEAAAMAPGRSWQVVAAQSSLPARGVMEAYRDVIAELASHCTAQGLTTADLVTECPVRVEPIPDYMRPVRSTAAFSMPPGHPPRGGTFFIQEAGVGDRLPADYRLLSAHETLPGHHLLDTCRWRQENPIRRHIEFPIFYEGWASFAEELLFETGFFAGPLDRLLMAKRRFWRAMRGQADFNLHMRRRSLEETAAALTAEGMPLRRARAMVRRYALKPGYQLAYTLGRRRFRRLYEAYGPRAGGAAGFARQVLAQGEIGFDHLAQVLRQGG